MSDCTCHRSETSLGYSAACPVLAHHRAAKAIRLHGRVKVLPASEGLNSLGRGTVIGLTFVQASEVSDPEQVYVVELDNGFYGQDGTDTFVSRLVVAPSLLEAL